LAEPVDARELQPPRKTSFMWGSSPTVDHGPKDALLRAVVGSTWIPAPWQIVKLQMVWIAAGMAGASIRGQVVLEILAIRERPLKGLIERSVGFHFLVAGV